MKNIKLKRKTKLYKIINFDILCSPKNGFDLRNNFHIIKTARIIMIAKDMRDNDSYKMFPTTVSLDS